MKIDVASLLLFSFILSSNTFLRRKLQSGNLLRYILIHNALESMEKTCLLGTEHLTEKEHDIFEPSVMMGHSQFIQSGSGMEDDEWSTYACPPPSSSQFDEINYNEMAMDLNSSVMEGVVTELSEHVTEDEDYLDQHQHIISQELPARASTREVDDAPIVVCRSTPEKRRACVMDGDGSDLDSFSPAKRRPSVCCYLYQAIAKPINI